MFMLAPFSPHSFFLPAALDVATRPPSNILLQLEPKTTARKCCSVTNVIAESPRKALAKIGSEVEAQDWFTTVEDEEIQAKWLEGGKPQNLDQAMGNPDLRLQAKTPFFAITVWQSARGRSSAG
jgi:hypothetical protein